MLPDPNRATIGACDPRLQRQQRFIADSNGRADRQANRQWEVTCGGV